ncbi:UNVERIFIED_CONTAM: hypothetical protein RMT77_013258 [Armadillidium vulgare]
MDSLLEGLSNFEVTPYTNNPNAEHPYFSLYKKKSSLNQEERRQRILEARKESRYDLLMHLRNIEEKQNDKSSSEDEMCVDEHKVIYKKPREYANFVMLSEWLVEVPEEFSEKYLALLCPVGRRCLCVCYKGRTTIYAKNGKVITRFTSLLPGGSKKTYKYGFTVLDCIWSETDKTYYIIDLIFWCKLSFMEVETAFRFEWLNSRIKEHEDDVTTVSLANKYRFIPAPYFNCDKNSLEIMFSNPLLEKTSLDGILFYNKFTHYTHGPTPLVCWLKAFMFPEVLGVKVPDKYMKEKPDHYANIQTHVLEYNQTKVNKTENFQSITADSGTIEMVMNASGE